MPKKLKPVMSRRPKKEDVKAAIIKMMDDATIPHDIDRIAYKLRKIGFNCPGDEVIYKWSMEMVKEGLIATEMTWPNPNVGAAVFYAVNKTE